MATATHYARETQNISAQTGKLLFKLLESASGFCSSWQPYPGDPGCNGWEPGESFPARSGPYPESGTEDQTGWESCTYVCSE